MKNRIICVNVHMYKEFLVLSTVGTKGKPTTSTLVET